MTIQLPLYNEMYVADRLIDAVCAIDYPRELLEIQVLDDSTDETREHRRARGAAAAPRRASTSSTSTATDRTGYKAGALEAGLKVGARRVHRDFRRRLPPSRRLPARG